MRHLNGFIVPQREPSQKLSRQFALTIASLLLITGCSGAVGNEPKSSTQPTEIWVDNWFNLTVNGTHIMSDSTPYNTERSFNSDRTTFTTTLPATIAMEFRDFMENNTGLEYIESPRQQIGDGGAIVQFKNEHTGDILKFTDASWKCKTIHHAPINQECAYEQDPKPGVGLCQAEIAKAPTDWTSPSFDVPNGPLPLNSQPKRFDQNAHIMTSNGIQMPNLSEVRISNWIILFYAVQ